MSLDSYHTLPKPSNRRSCVWNTCFSIWHRPTYICRQLQLTDPIKFRLAVLQCAFSRSQTVANQGQDNTRRIRQSTPNNTFQFILTLLRRDECDSVHDRWNAVKYCHHLLWSVDVQKEGSWIFFFFFPTWIQVTRWHSEAVQLDTPSTCMSVQESTFKTSSS